MAAPVPKCWRPFFHRLPIRTMTNGGHGKGGSITGRFRTELNSTGSNSQLAAPAVDAQLHLVAKTPDSKLVYSGRAGTGMPVMELERLWQRLQPLQVDKMPLSAPPPRGGRSGSPLVLSRVHWVRPEMVVKVSTPNGRRMVSSGMSFI
jgi:ATP-dependent DNA ligase